MVNAIRTFSSDDTDLANWRKAERLYPNMKFSRLINMILVEWLEVNGVEPVIRRGPEDDI